MTKPRDLLVLKYGDFRREASHLFEALNRDPRLRHLFFTNPALVLKTKLPSLAGAGIDDQQDEIANRILFSVLTNDRFLDFLNEFQERKTKALSQFLDDPNDRQAASELDDHKIRSEFIEALLKFGDKELMSNMLLSASGPQIAGSYGYIIYTYLGILITYIVVIGIDVIVHTVVKLGIAGEVVSTSPEGFPISASELRKITDQLVASAKKARDAGSLTS
jgi:hypothetical protein